MLTRLQVYRCVACTLRSAAVHCEQSPAGLHQAGPATLHKWVMQIRRVGFSTADLRTSLMSSGNRQSSVPELSSLLRAFSSTHVAVMTHSELIEWQMVLRHEDVQIWRWIEDGHTTPYHMMDNSAFALFQQFARYWTLGGTREYK